MGATKKAPLKVFQVISNWLDALRGSSQIMTAYENTKIEKVLLKVFTQLAAYCSAPDANSNIL